MIGNDDTLFGKVVTAMVTPFDESLNIDFKAVEKLVNHLANNGTNTIVVAGTTGESPTLTDSEKKDLLKAVLDAAGGKCKVIFGAGSNDTARSIKCAQEAEQLGAHGLLLVAPYYNKPNAAGLKAHFSAIAESTTLPIMLYNIPGRTGITIGADVVLSLAENHKNIRALKDSTGSTDQAAEIGRDGPADFRLYSGDDYLTLPFLAVGACGVVSVASHIAGKEILDLINAFFKGDTESARKIHYGSLALFKGLFSAPNPTCVKYALSLCGLCKSYLRLPLVQLDNEQKQAVAKLLKITLPQ